MKLIKITYTRKYNLGNYETHDITLEAELQDDDSPATVLTSLANVASDWHLSQKREAAQQPVKTPAQLANEEYTRTHPLNPSVQAGIDINKLPPELRQHLTYNDGQIFSEYTSKEKWTQINQALKQLGYEWVSAGKDSHWRLKQ